MCYVILSCHEAVCLVSFLDKHDEQVSIEKTPVAVNQFFAGPENQNKCFRFFLVLLKWIDKKLIRMRSTTSQDNYTAGKRFL